MTTKELIDTLRLMKFSHVFIATIKINDELIEVEVYYDDGAHPNHAIIKVEDIYGQDWADELPIDQWEHLMKEAKETCREAYFTGNEF